MMVGIQADDLTGACDTGAPFAARGLETLVVVHDGTGRRPVRRKRRGPRRRHRESDAVGRGGARAGARGRRALEGRAAPHPLQEGGLDAPRTRRRRDRRDARRRRARPGAPGARLPRPAPHGRRRVSPRRRPAPRRDGDRARPRVPAHRGERPRRSSPPAACGRPPPCRSATVRRGPDAWRRGSGASPGTVGASWSRTPRPTRISRSWRRRAGGRPMLLAGSAGLAAALAGLRRPRRPASGGSVPRRPLVVVAGSAHPATRAQSSGSRLSPREGLDVLAPPRDGGADDPARRRETARAWRTRRARASSARGPARSS